MSHVSRIQKAIGADDLLLGPPEKDRVDIAGRKDIGGNVDDPDGCHEDVKGGLTCYIQPLGDSLANVV